MRFLVSVTSILLMLVIGTRLFADIHRVDSLVSTEKEKVYFSDLIGVETKDSDHLSQLLVASLKPGEEVTLSNREVSRLARKATRGDTSYYIPSEVKIRRLSQVEKFEDQIIARIKETTGAERVEMLEFRFPEDALSKSHNISLALPDKVTNGVFNLPLFDLHAGQRRNVGWVSGRYQSFRSVPVAKINMNIGDKVPQDAVVFQEREISRSNDMYPDERILFTSIIRVPRQAGQVISLSDLKKEQVVKRNQRVKAIIKAKGWSVSVSGIAKGSGYVGDDVNFFNPETKKKIAARIIGDGLVEIVR